MVHISQAYVVTLLPRLRRRCSRTTFSASASCFTFSLTIGRTRQTQWWGGDLFFFENTACLDMPYDISS